MRAENPTISFLELKRLLVDLEEKQPGISIRYRLLGETWYHNFVKIVKANEHDLTVKDEIADKVLFIRDLRAIIQFELDSPFQTFEPHFHYDVAMRRQYILF